MLGSELREVRRKLRMTRLEMARVIGFTGTDRNDVVRIRRFENGVQQIPLYIARAVWMLAVWVRRTGDLPPFPVWPNYEFEHIPDPGHAANGAMTSQQRADEMLAEYQAEKERRP